MRLCERNKQTLYYALYVSKEDILDEYGNKTGDYEITYSTPTELKANVSANRGAMVIEPFGINSNYTRTMVVEDMNCPITKGSVLWIDTPLFVEDADETITPLPYNYVVTQVAKGIDSIVYAIKEVDVE